MKVIGALCRASNFGPPTSVSWETKEALVQRGLGKNQTAGGGVVTCRGTGYGAQAVVGGRDPSMGGNGGINPGKEVIPTVYGV